MTCDIIANIQPIFHLKTVYVMCAKLISMAATFETYIAGVKSICMIFAQPRFATLGVLLYPVVVWLFVYVTNLSAFMYILSSEAMAASDKLLFIVASMLNVFIHIGDPLALSIVLFSAVATLNLVVLVYVLRRQGKVEPKGSGGAVVGLVGAHCIACGGSFLAPIITALAGSGAYISTARAETATMIALSVNVLAFVLILHATLKLASRVGARKLSTFGAKF